MIDDDCSMDEFVSVRLGFFWGFFFGGGGSLGHNLKCSK